MYGINTVSEKTKSGHAMSSVPLGDNRVAVVPLISDPKPAAKCVHTMALEVPAPGTYIDTNLDEFVDVIHTSLVESLYHNHGFPMTAASSLKVIDNVMYESFSADMRITGLSPHDKTVYTGVFMRVVPVPGFVKILTDELTTRVGGKSGAGGVVITNSYGGLAKSLPTGGEGLDDGTLLQILNTVGVAPFQWGRDLQSLTVKHITAPPAGDTPVFSAGPAGAGTGAGAGAGAGPAAAGTPTPQVHGVFKHVHLKLSHHRPEATCTLFEVEREARERAGFHNNLFCHLMVKKEEDTTGDGGEMYVFGLQVSPGYVFTSGRRLDLTEGKQPYANHSAVCTSFLALWRQFICSGLSMAKGRKCHTKGIMGPAGAALSVPEPGLVRPEGGKPGPWRLAISPAHDLIPVSVEGSGGASTGITTYVTPRLTLSTAASFAIFVMHHGMTKGFPVAATGELFLRVAAEELYTGPATSETPSVSTTGWATAVTRAKAVKELAKTSATPTLEVTITARTRVLSLGPCRTPAGFVPVVDDLDTPTSPPPPA